MFTRHYQCPECVKVFSYDHHPSIEADPPPRYCPFCAYDTQGDEPLEAALVMPHIGGQVAKVIDGNYRAEEEGSQHRANVAESMGLDTEAANALKITNMRDNLREGDVAAMPVRNAVTDFMAQNPNAGGFTPGNSAFQNPAAIAASTSSQVQSGPYPNAGAAAMHRLRQEHRKFTASAGHAGATTSDTPALETQQPGYRPRVRAV